MAAMARQLRFSKYGRITDVYMKQGCEPGLSMRSFAVQEGSVHHRCPTYPVVIYFQQEILGNLLEMVDFPLPGLSPL